MQQPSLHAEGCRAAPHRGGLCTLLMCWPHCQACVHRLSPDTTLPIPWGLGQVHGQLCSKECQLLPQVTHFIKANSTEKQTWVQVVSRARVCSFPLPLHSEVSSHHQPWPTFRPTERLKGNRFLQQLPQSYKVTGRSNPCNESLFLDQRFCF